jgi:isoquinoline 1-oxidoreductase beta subunit
MSDTLAIEVHMVKGNSKLGGIGEPSVPPVVPSVANAVFTSAGIRVRRLPMKPEVVREAIKQG